MYALIALGATTIATFAMGTWFVGSDAAWIARATGAGVDRPTTPAAAAVWAVLFRLSGWRYGPYQFVQAGLWLATVGMFAAMCEQLWGRRRPAVVAAALAGGVMAGSIPQLLQLTHLSLSLELLLGFASVALAAAGWRARRWSLIVGSWLPLAAACLGSPTAMLYLPVLHIGSLLVAWYRRTPPKVMALGLLGMLAVVVTCGVSVAMPMDSWTLTGAFERWASHHRQMARAPVGLILPALAAVAGFAQGMRLQWRAGPLVAALGAAMAAACLLLDPVVAVLILTILSPRAWPFAVWAVVQWWIVGVDPGAFAMAPVLSGFACASVMVIAIWRSPLAVWASRSLRRMDPAGRRLIYSGVALLAVLGAAHCDQWVDHQIRMLRMLGRRRLVHRDILTQLTETASPRSRVGLVTYADMGLTEQTVADYPVGAWAEIVESFTPDQYALLLSARGRGDLVVTSVSALPVEGGWLIATSPAAKRAAASMLGRLPEPRLDVSDDEFVGGLWRIEQSAVEPPAPAPQPTTEPAAQPTTQPAAE